MPALTGLPVAVAVLAVAVPVGRAGAHAGGLSLLRLAVRAAEASVQAQGVLSAAHLQNCQYNNCHVAIDRLTCHLCTYAYVQYLLLTFSSLQSQSVLSALHWPETLPMEWQEVVQMLE